MINLLYEDPARLLKSGSESGHAWLVAHNQLGFRNGYIQVPAGHPWHGGDTTSCYDGIEVHGGITYAEPDHDDRSWWLGFDTAHSADGQDLSLPHQADMSDVFNGHIWTLDEVVAECENLCQQAAAALESSAEESSDAEVR